MACKENIMIYSEFIRRIAFWSIDLIRGAPVAHHVKDLRKTFANPQESQQLAKQRLDNILDHACKTTAFYKKFSGWQKLEDFPVIQKKTIKENYNDFTSSIYKNKKLFKTTTSGSYGTPMTFLLSSKKRARQLAEIIFFNSWAGYKVGMRYAQVRVHPKGKFHLFRQNGVLINPSVIDSNWLEKNRNLLKKKKILFIVAYPSAILPLAKYCREKGDKPNDFVLKGIISGAEQLLHSVRKTFEETFGCIVFDRYALNELGVVSHECPSHKKHHINLASYKVEILKLDSDWPAGPDETGRVVVTDLFSFAMPLIRYDTGDRSSFSSKSCPCGLDTPILNKIEGRVVESICDPSGKIINMAAIDRDPKDLDGIIQFQFIQKTKDTYIVKLKVTDSFTQENILRERYLKLLGPQAKLIFEYVDSIPPLPSGKRPYIINEYIQRIKTSQ